MILYTDPCRPAMELVSELHKHSPGPLRLTVACSQRYLAVQYHHNDPTSQRVNSHTIPLLTAMGHS